MAEFGDLLSELRRDKKLTQEELARELFVSPGTISNYENNVHYAPAHLPANLRLFLNILP